jgi:bacteriocin-like protein
MLCRQQGEWTMRDHNNVEEVPSLELTDEELSSVSGGVQYGDIKGEATSEGHTKWIQL